MIFLKHTHEAPLSLLYFKKKGNDKGVCYNLSVKTVGALLTAEVKFGLMMYVKFCIKFFSLQFWNTLNCLHPQYRLYVPYTQSDIEKSVQLIQFSCIQCCICGHVIMSIFEQ